MCFYKRCGYSDMVFTVQQLFEKSIEHCRKQFIIFVDMTKCLMNYIAACTAETYCTRSHGRACSIFYYEGMKATQCVLMITRINVLNTFRY